MAIVVSPSVAIETPNRLCYRRLAMFLLVKLLIVPLAAVLAYVLVRFLAKKIYNLPMNSFRKSWASKWLASLFALVVVPMLIGLPSEVISPSYGYGSMWPSAIWGSLAGVILASILTRLA